MLTKLVELVEQLFEANQTYGEMAVLGHLGFYQKAGILEYGMEQSFD